MTLYVQWPGDKISLACMSQISMNIVIVVEFRVRYMYVQWPGDKISLACMSKMSMNIVIV